MPGCLRHSLPHMLEEVEEAWKFGVRTFILFPQVSGADTCAFFMLPTITAHGETEFEAISVDQTV